MREKKFLNFLSGVIAGLVAVFLLLEEGIFVRSLLTGPYDKLGRVVYLLICLLAVFVFFLVARQFWRGQSQKLISYYLKAILVSAATTILALYLILWIFMHVVSADRFASFLSTLWGMFVGANLLYFLFAALVVIFVCVFSCLTKKKISYMQLISKEIKKIEKEGFGMRIPVYGEDELANLSVSINHMAEELQAKEEKAKQMERQRKELITNVSHDLRSPLTSIIGYVELLKESVGEEPEKVLEYVGVVERRLQGLNRLIDELFELTKLDSEGGLHLEPIDVTALLIHMTEEYALLYEGRNLHLQKEIEERVFYIEADIEKVARAIQNILDNAGKYAKPESTIKISTQILERNRRKQFIFSLSNEWDSVLEQDLEKLFERSYRGDQARSDDGSSGLGLAIARRIIELHNGTLTARLEENRIVFEMIFIKSKE